MRIILCETMKFYWKRIALIGDIFVMINVGKIIIIKQKITVNKFNNIIFKESKETGTVSMKYIFSSKLIILK